METILSHNLAINCYNNVMKSALKRSSRDIFNHIVLFFVIGCVIGTYYEEILCLVRTFIGTGEWQWVSRRGLLYGPFSPVYGIGAVLVYVLFYRPQLKFWPSVLLGALFGGALEILLSLGQEIAFGTRSWNYYDQLWPIFNGRTTIPFMIFWGLLVGVVNCYLYPWLEKFYQKLPLHSVDIICTILAVLLVLDITISIAASVRQSARRAGQPATTPIGIFLDEVYDDERMKKTFDNAIYIRE